MDVEDALGKNGSSLSGSLPSLSLSSRGSWMVLLVASLSSVVLLVC